MTKCSRSLTLFIEPSLVIQLKEDNQLLISFLVSNYRNEAYTSSNESPLSSVSSKINDDPSFIPGRTTTYGTGISFFWLWFWSKGNQFNGKQDGDFLILYCYLKPTYSHLSAVVHNLSVLKLS